MSAETKISSKGQVVIPKDIRTRLGLKPGDRVRFDVLEGKRVVMQPAVKPPPDVFVEAGSRRVEEILHDSSEMDDRKVARLLRALGVPA